MPEVSIIIRTKNEERWISSCLQAVFKQKYTDFEVIIVDSGSTDKTIVKAKQFDVRIVYIDEFFPGKAINLGVRNSSGKYICCLSGHCIPTNDRWLSNLVRNLEIPDVAGVYGRQEPLSFTSDFDKRDLLIAFGLDKKIQTKDSFFHNANSLIKRAIWERIPFDETVTNIEDRIWASEVLKLGYKLIYEPEASVYHYHGIHQELDRERCHKIVRILETLDNHNLNHTVDINKLCIVCVIPVKGDIIFINNRPLLDFTMKRALESKYVKHIVLASDNPDYLKLVEGFNKIIYLERPPQLSLDYVEINEILKYSLDELEKNGIIPDIVIYMSITYPFRPKNLIDNIINLLIKKGFDSVLPTIGEHRSCWREENGNLIRIDEGFMPSKYKKPLHIGLSGLATATHAEFIRKGERLGPKVGLFDLDDLVYSIDVGKHHNLNIAQKIIDEWWKKNS